MKSLRHLLVLTAALLASASSARASITFTVIGAEDLLQGGLSSPLALQDSLVLLVADTAGDSSFDFLNFGNISVGAPVAPGSDEIIVGRLTLAGDGLLYSSPTLSLFGNWTQGDPLAIYWIPSLTASNFTVTGGTPYGIYSNVSLSGNSAAWITPADGTPAYPAIYFDTTGAAFEDVNAPASTGYSSFTVVPEPSTFAVVFGAIGVGLALFRRRRA